MQARNTYDRSAILAGYIAPASTFSQTPAVPEDDDYDEDIEEDDFQDLGVGTLQVCKSTGKCELYFCDFNWFRCDRAVRSIVCWTRKPARHQKGVLSEPYTNHQRQQTLSKLYICFNQPRFRVVQGSRGPQEPFFDGPAAWEEVDTEELERIAVNIMRSVVPSTENLEVGARLAMQAAAMEADNQDPLGLGRIDTRQLALVSFVSRQDLLNFQKILRFLRDRTL